MKVRNDEEEQNHYMGKRCEETWERMKQKQKDMRWTTWSLQPYRSHWCCCDLFIPWQAGLVLNKHPYGVDTLRRWYMSNPKRCKDPSFTSQTMLIRLKINVCSRFPIQSSLHRSQVGSLGSVSLWSLSNINWEGCRSSTLQVCAFLRAKARWNNYTRLCGCQL